MVTRRATSKDVADRAGVSRAAVSLVLNGRSDGNISAANQAAIRAAAVELNYTPNSVARSLRAQRTRTLGVVTDAIATTAFGGRILSGATEVAAAAGYVLLVIDTWSGEDLEAAAWASLRARQVDGLLFAAMGLRPYAPPAVMQELPSVLVNCFDPDEAVASVACDEVQGGRTAARALLDHGHQDIAMLAGTSDVVATHRRLQGYTDALGAAGVEVRVVQGAGRSATGTPRPHRFSTRSTVRPASSARTTGRRSESSWPRPSGACRCPATSRSWATTTTRTWPP